MSKPVFEDVFSFSCRRNRKSFVLLSLTLGFANALLMGGVVVGLVAFFGVVKFGAFFGVVDTEGYGQLALLGLCMPSLVLQCFAGAQRCRDFGWSGWAVLIIFIPLVGSIFSFVLLFLPGNVGTNRFGPDPLDSIREQPQV